MRKGRGSKQGERERERCGEWRGKGRQRRGEVPLIGAAMVGRGYGRSNSCRNSSGAILGIILDGRGVILGLAKKFIN